MAVLRIQKQQIKSDRQYFLDSGELVGKTYYKRNYFVKYKAATFREGRERYVLQIRDLRSLLAPLILLLGVLLLPERIWKILTVPVIVILLFFPRLDTIWTDGKLIAREHRQRFLIGQDCYELRHHNGYRSSLMKNGTQAALYTMKTAYGLCDPLYEILYDERMPLDILILFCVYLDVSNDIALRGKTPWKDWVPWDRYREQANWQPPEPCAPSPQDPSTIGLPGDSTD